MNRYDVPKHLQDRIDTLSHQVAYLTTVEQDYKVLREKYRILEREVLAKDQQIYMMKNGIELRKSHRDYIYREERRTLFAELSLRKPVKLSWREFGRRLHINHCYFTRLKRGERIPTDAMAVLKQWLKHKPHK